MAGESEENANAESYVAVLRNGNGQRQHLHSSEEDGAATMTFRQAKLAPDLRVIPFQEYARQGMMTASEAELKVEDFVHLKG